MKRVGTAWLSITFAAVIARPPAVSASEGCAISGRILDERGVAIPYAAVSALLRPPGAHDLLTTRSPVSGAVAGPTGEYCIRELPPGQYVIRAVARKQPPSASPECDSCCVSRMSEFQTTFYPASASRERAVPIVVGDGKNADGTDIILRRVPAYCVRGEVRDSNGVLRADVALTLEADSWSAGVINDGGRFLLTNLPPGSYTVAVHDRPKPGRVLARRVIRVGARNVLDIVIRIPLSSR